MNYFDFGLILSALWLTTLTGAMGIIIGATEVIKRLGRKRQITGEEKATDQDKGSFQGEAEKVEITQEEAEALIAIAAVAAYMGDEEKERGS